MKKKILATRKFEKFSVHKKLQTFYSNAKTKFSSVNKALNFINKKKTIQNKRINQNKTTIPTVIPIVTFCILFLAGVFVVLVKPGGEFGLTAAGDTIYFSYFLLASIVGFWAFKYYTWKSSHGKIIFYLSLGMFLSFVAGLILWYYEVISRLPYPYPSLADYVWVAAYIPMLIAVIYGIFTVRSTLNFTKITIAVTPWIILLFFTAKYLLAPIVMDTSSPLIEKVFNFIYPFTDLVLVLCISMLAVALIGGALSKAWAFILIGMSAYYLGDLAFSYLIWNDLYYTGNPTDLLWWTGGLLIAFGFYYLKEALDKKM